MNRKFTVALVAVCCLALAMTLVAQAGGDASSKVEALEEDASRADEQRRHLVSAAPGRRLCGGAQLGVGDQGGRHQADAGQVHQVHQSGISDVKVATFGDNTAIAHYKFTYDATFNGTHRARSVICSDTWVSQSGEWKLASNHCSHVEGT